MTSRRGHLRLPEDIDPSTLHPGVWNVDESDELTIMDLWNNPSMPGPFRTPCGGFYENLGLVEQRVGHRIHLMKVHEVGDRQSPLTRGHTVKMAIGPNGGIERAPS